MKGGRVTSNVIRSGTWSENKYTNLTPYCPFNSQVDKIINEHRTSLLEGKEIMFHQYKVTAGLYQPLGINDIKQYIEKIPPVFLKGLRGFFICPGSKKQKNYRIGTFGCYDYFFKSIFIFPFPNESLSLSYKYKLKPSKSIEYERHGAVWEFEDGIWKLKFDRSSLKSFYLKDVLIHEIGHHVDNMTSLKGTNRSEREKFAEWFAMEFGIKSANREKSEFGKVLEELIERE